MTGTSATTFAPGGYFTRAQVAATLFRVEHGRAANANDSRQNNFTDVPDHEWFAPYVTWAANQGIVTGTSPITFAPNNNASRQEFAVMLFRFAGEPAGAPVNQLDGFTDRNQIANWAVDAIRWANYQGIITGATAATINPTGLMTRAQAAVMLTRYLDPDEPAPEHVNIAPLLGRNFQEVRHYLGDGSVDPDSAGFSSDYLWVMNFDGYISSIYILFSSRSEPAPFHFNGVDGTATRSCVIAMLGADYYYEDNFSDAALSALMYEFADDSFVIIYIRDGFVSEISLYSGTSN